MAATRQRGRPRIPATEQRILTETLRLLGKVGYARMSLANVAAAAHISKPTIYLRYASKEVLAIAALTHARERLPPPPATGNVAVDLSAQLRHFQEGITFPHGLSMIGAILAEEHAIPELLATYREQIVRPRRLMIRHVLADAQQRGECSPTADLDLAVAQLIGSYYSLYIAGEPIPPDWPERITQQILQGIG